jgi:isopenicillin-N epimerase
MRRRDLLSGIALLGSGVAYSRRREVERPAAPPVADDWESVRRQFPLDRRWIHMSQFFLASHPQPVRAAIEGTGGASTRTPSSTSRKISSASRRRPGRPLPSTWAASPTTWR